LGEEDYKFLHAVVETLAYLTHSAKDKRAAEIYQILGSSKSEKTRKILRVLQLEPDARDNNVEPAEDASSQAAPEAPASDSPSSMAGQPTQRGDKKKPKGQWLQWSA